MSKSFPNKYPGAMVISLDFELFWGLHQALPIDGGSYRECLLGARDVVPKLLELFEHHGIAATWATVGKLFASTRAELEAHTPRHRPKYIDPLLNPYRHLTGADEQADPIRYAGSLVERIAASPGQEIASHTFSHYYCREPGHCSDSFNADLQSAVAIASAKGLRLRSMVFPKNQHNDEFAEILLANGFDCYRGNQPGWMYASGPHGQVSRTPVRAARLLDAYLPLTTMSGADWNALQQPTGLVCVPASAFLRPYSPRLRAANRIRISRLKGAMERAARERRIFHLWWHPHNFGRYMEENLQTLDSLLDYFAQLRRLHGMESLSMGDIAERCRG